MSDNVRRVVDALFEEIEENEEVRSIHDEVLNNCRERYENLVSSGYSEEEAIGAVVESLKGMDEVLAEYPRKARWTDADFSKEGAGPATENVIAWERVRRLKVSVRGAEVEVYETDGRSVMDLTQGSESVLKARVEGDALVITQEKREVPVREEETAQGLLGALAKLITSAVNSMDAGSDCRARIGVPAGSLERAEITTLSGDIRFAASVGEAVLQTTSGDLTADLAASPAMGGFTGVHCDRLQASSISGDMDVRGDIAWAALNSTSGDVDFAGRCGELKISTVSGDVEAEAVSEQVRGSTVSGDFSLALPGVSRAEISLQTVSGDVCLSVPEAREGISVSASTRSGDVNYRNVTLRDGAPIAARIQTVSGDVEVAG